MTIQWNVISSTIPLLRIGSLMVPRSRCYICCLDFGVKVGRSMICATGCHVQWPPVSLDHEFITATIS
ncbi:hypothetical protein Tsubulata_047536 [Turnera subulata]|uniref:Uncharacterized protein n=1 Tax=Turnera subulata TaxID=218843 RepID=A0A9Q0GKC7_9ROSI|nr:hypothetical protein Tsubulata_047536 [Turnera subulata]